jgi:hypothetical protein
MIRVLYEIVFASCTSSLGLLTVHFYDRRRTKARVLAFMRRTLVAVNR